MKLTKQIRHIQFDDDGELFDEDYTEQDFHDYTPQDIMAAMKYEMGEPADHDFAGPVATFYAEWEQNYQTGDEEELIFIVQGDRDEMETLFNLFSKQYLEASQPPQQPEPRIPNNVIQGPWAC